MTIKVSLELAARGGDTREPKHFCQVIFLSDFFILAPDSEEIMEIDVMGRTVTEATIENLQDLWDAERGLIPGDNIRRVTIDDALVDTGATLLSLPTRLIRQLGLKKHSTRRVTSSTGVVEAAIYDAVRLTIQGRDCTMDVVEVPDSVPALIGQIPLEHLDFIVDPVSRRLIGNPAHGGEHMHELF